MLQKTLADWVKDLIDPDAREMALLELSKQREKFPELAPFLWNSFGTMAVLLQVRQHYQLLTFVSGATRAVSHCQSLNHSPKLQEITLIYPQLHPPELNAQASNRVCNALALFQCVASHSETRELFLQAQIPLFLYPFLNTTSKTRPFEYLRLTALGVIGALVKQDDSTVRAYVVDMCLTRNSTEYAGHLRTHTHAQHVTPIPPRRVHAQRARCLLRAPTLRAVALSCRDA